MPYCDNKEIIFLHIPKTGGTTISKIFDVPFLHDPNPGTTPTPQHLTCGMLRERVGDEKYDSYYKFTFVRNPWSRILSSYFWRQSLPKKRPILPFGDFVENARQVVSDRQYYQQEFGDHFIPMLSILDVLMFNEPHELHALLHAFALKAPNGENREEKISEASLRTIE